MAPSCLQVFLKNLVFLALLLLLMRTALAAFNLMSMGNHEASLETLRSKVESRSLPMSLVPPALKGEILMKKMTKVTKEVAREIGCLHSVQKLALFGMSCSGIALFLLSRWFRRQRRLLTPPPHHQTNRSMRAVRRARKISMQSSSEVPLNRFPPSSNCPPFNWGDLQRQSAYSGPRESLSSVATLVDGTPLTPQQLGLMGMEALETVVGYWEDALSSYSRSNKSIKSLTTAEESAFIRMLEGMLEATYQLQEESESLFIHQNSVLNQANDAASTVDGSVVKDSDSKCNLLSVSSVDNDSFVSAQDTIADLRDFSDDLGELLADLDSSNQQLYLEALELLDRKETIPCRLLRTDFVGCSSDSEYLAKLHCLRLAFNYIMGQVETRSWWIETGRKMLSDLLARSEKDPKDFCLAYDNLVDFLETQENVDQMQLELESRNVQCNNFYDIALDYILVDSFEDLECPPSSVSAVMNNRWLSNGFKESALNTAIWGVLKAKRRLLIFPDGFKAQFYDISEILTPAIAWGFFGPDENQQRLMHFFKDQVLGFVRDLYCCHKVRYSTIEEMADDIMRLASHRVETVDAHLSAIPSETETAAGHEQVNGKMGLDDALL